MCKEGGYDMEVTSKEGLHIISVAIFYFEMNRLSSQREGLMMVKKFPK